MKFTTKLVALGVAAAAAGVFLYKKYQNSYEQIPDNAVSQADSDFVPMVSVADDFEIITLHTDQIMFEE